MSNDDSTTRFCKHCKQDTARNKSGECKLCVKARNAAYRAANPDKEKARKAAWRSANRERIKSYGATYHAANRATENAASATWRAENPGKQAASTAAWAKANPEKVKAARANWCANNQEKAIAASRAWHKANPDARRIYEQNRLARKRENGGTLSQGLMEKLFAQQKGKCVCCKQPLGDDYHLDHINPLSLGGANTDDNIQLLRQKCNNQKSNKDPILFMQSRGFLL